MSNEKEIAGPRLGPMIPRPQERGLQTAKARLNGCMCASFSHTRGSGVVVASHTCTRFHPTSCRDRHVAPGLTSCQRQTTSVPNEPTPPAHITYNNTNKSVCRRSYARLADVDLTSIVRH